jgi:two-component system chemotaxis response regulator CheY
MVTAEAQKSRVLEAVQAGVSNYIVKPFTAETVKAKLEQVFK